MIESITTRVDRGIKILDMMEPTWRKQLDLEVLNLGSINYCILGQVYGGYLDGVSFLFDGDNDEAIGHGFEVSADNDTYEQLNRAWKYAIKEDIR